MPELPALLQPQVPPGQSTQAAPGCPSAATVTSSYVRNGVRVQLGLRPAAVPSHSTYRTKLANSSRGAKS